jgi:hypothetical protein
MQIKSVTFYNWRSGSLFLQPLYFLFCFICLITNPSCPGAVKCVCFDEVSEVARFSGMSYRVTSQINTILYDDPVAFITFVLNICDFVSHYILPHPKQLYKYVYFVTFCRVFEV